MFAFLKAYKLWIHPSKCAFFAQQMDFVGHQISRTGLHPQEEKTRAIYDMPVPKDIINLGSTRTVFLLPEVCSSVFHYRLSSQPPPKT